MEALLLVLILIGDPSGADLGKGLGEELQRRAGEKVSIRVGAEALEPLTQAGLAVSDLLATPNIANHLTGGTPPKPLIIIHLDRSEKAGDILVESRVWTAGQAERHIAIAGKGGDPLPAVTAGIVDLIGKRIGAQGEDAPLDDVELARLAERNEWRMLLGRLASVEQRTPRQRYYEILAYVRLGQRDPAVEALNQLRGEAPDHFLIPAAAELIPPIAPEPAPAPAPATTDDGSNVLRD